MALFGHHFPKVSSLIYLWFCRVLDNALKGSIIRKQDMLSAIIGVGQNPVGRLQAWEFYKANFDKIVKR